MMIFAFFEFDITRGKRAVLAFIPCKGTFCLAVCRHRLPMPSYAISNRKSSANSVNQGPHIQPLRTCFFPIRTPFHVSQPRDSVMVVTPEAMQ